MVERTADVSASVKMTVGAGARKACASAGRMARWMSSGKSRVEASPNVTGIKPNPMYAAPEIHQARRATSAERAEKIRWSGSWLAMLPRAAMKNTPGPAVETGATPVAFPLRPGLPDPLP